MRTDTVPNRASIQSTTPPPAGRPGRVISDLVMAEIFLVQATIESATALGDGLGALRRRAGDAGDTAPTRTEPESVGEVIKRTRREMVEPYAARFDMFRKLLETNRDA